MTAPRELAQYRHRLQAAYAAAEIGVEALLASSPGVQLEYALVMDCWRRVASVLDASRPARD